MAELKSCPWCGEKPEVGPLEPKVGGDGWGYVKCVNVNCLVRPECENYWLPDGVYETSENYKKQDIIIWNDMKINQQVCLEGCKCHD